MNAVATVVPHRLHLDDESIRALPVLQLPLLFGVSGQPLSNRDEFSMQSRSVFLFDRIPWPCTKRWYLELLGIRKQKARRILTVSTPKEVVLKDFWETVLKPKLWTIIVRAVRAT